MRGRWEREWGKEEGVDGEGEGEGEEGEGGGGEMGGEGEEGGEGRKGPNINRRSNFNSITSKFAEGSNVFAFSTHDTFTWFRELAYS